MKFQILEIHEYSNSSAAVMEKKNAQITNVFMRCSQLYCIMIFLMLTTAEIQMGCQKSVRPSTTKVIDNESDKP